MGNMVAKFIDFGLRSLERRPMLTPMMMYAVGFGAAPLIISLSVWRDASCSPNPQKFYPLYMVSITPDIAGRNDARGLNANIVLDQAARSVARIA
jgi:hypothetical protein